MAVTADTWEELPGDDGRRARVLAALALSLACHALVLAGMRGWRVADPPPARLLVVTMAAGGGAPSGPGAAGAASAAAVSAAAAPGAPAYASAARAGRFAERG